LEIIKCWLLQELIVDLIESRLLITIGLMKWTHNSVEFKRNNVNCLLKVSKCVLLILQVKLNLLKVNETLALISLLILNSNI